MGGNKSRRLGTALRIYKDASENVIGMDDIEVVVDNIQKKDYTFHRSVNSIHVKRTLFHLVVSGSREVAIIQVLGDYSSIEENGGDFLIAQWNKTSDSENDVQISLDGLVAKVGDTI